MHVFANILLIIKKFLKCKRFYPETKNCPFKIWEAKLLDLKGKNKNCQNPPTPLSVLPSASSCLVPTQTPAPPTSVVQELIWCIGYIQLHLPPGLKQTPTSHTRGFQLHWEPLFLVCSSNKLRKSDKGLTLLNPKVTCRGKLTHPNRLSAQETAQAGCEMPRHHFSLHLPRGRN